MRTSSSEIVFCMQVHVLIWLVYGVCMMLLWLWMRECLHLYIHMLIIVGWTQDFAAVLSVASVVKYCYTDLFFPCACLYTCYVIGPTCGLH